MENEKDKEKNVYIGIIHYLKYKIFSKIWNR